MSRSSGYEKLMRAVDKDCSENCNCFNSEGCDIENQSKDGKRCFHAYCDKFKWAIDRAKHYAEKTGLKWEDILDSWENDRSYWYMNYYQDANQPEIKGDNVRVFDTIDDMRKSIGEMKFRCPACGGVSTDPCNCNSGLKMESGKTCDWKSWGLLGTMGKGVNIFVKEKLSGTECFMPLSWEKRDESDKV